MGFGVGFVGGAMGIGGPFGAPLLSMGSNAAGQGINVATTGTQFSVSGVFAAGAGRLLFGATTGFFSPAGVSQTVSMGIGSGVVSGLVSGAVGASGLP